MDGIVRKRRKRQIPRAESSENDENCKFRGQNRQKTVKTANSVDGIVKKRRKLRFPTLGKVKNRQKQRFPTLGKGKITQKPRFPTLGKTKSPENCVSQLWERQNHPKTAFPNFGKDKSTQKLRFGAPRRAEKRKKPCVARKRNAKSPNFRSSLASETQNHPISARRLQAKRKITQFPLVARKRNAKSLNFRASLVSETQNRPKARSTKRRKCLQEQ